MLDSKRRLALYPYRILATYQSCHILDSTENEASNTTCCWISRKERGERWRDVVDFSLRDPCSLRPLPLFDRKDFALFAGTDDTTSASHFSLVLSVIFCRIPFLFQSSTLFLFLHSTLQADSLFTCEQASFLRLGNH